LAFSDETTSSLLETPKLPRRLPRTPFQVPDNNVPQNIDIGDPVGNPDHTMDSPMPAIPPSTPSLPSTPDHLPFPGYGDPDDSIGDMSVTDQTMDDPVDPPPAPPPFQPSSFAPYQPPPQPPPAPPPAPAVDMNVDDEAMPPIYVPPAVVPQIAVDSEGNPMIQVGDLEPQVFAPTKHYRIHSRPRTPEQSPTAKARAVSPFRVEQEVARIEKKLADKHMPDYDDDIHPNPTASGSNDLGPSHGPVTPLLPLIEDTPAIVAGSPASAPVTPSWQAPLPEEVPVIDDAVSDTPTIAYEDDQSLFIDTS
jgi:hypothetical protein